MSFLVLGKGLVLSVPPDELPCFIFPFPAAYGAPYVVLKEPPWGGCHRDLVAQDSPVLGSSAHKAVAALCIQAGCLSC